MTEIDIIYLQPDRTHIRVTGAVEPMTRTAASHELKQAHSISSDRVFLDAPPPVIDSLEELQTMPAPIPPPEASRGVLAIQRSQIVPFHPEADVPVELEMLEVEMANAISMKRAPGQAREDDAREQQRHDWIRWSSLAVFALSLAVAAIGLWQLIGRDALQGVV